MKTNAIKFIAAFFVAALPLGFTSCGDDEEEIVEIIVYDDNEPICPDSNHPHAIDMDEAGVWACCNVGASNPLQYGSYVAWGEIEDKSYYSFSTYKYKNGTQYSNIGSDIGGKTDYDVSTARWGSSWLIPSNEQMKKLIKCKSTWKKINGVYGILFEASNKNKIFLPATGFRHDASLSYAGEYAELCVRHAFIFCRNVRWRL